MLADKVHVLFLVDGHNPDSGRKFDYPIYAWFAAGMNHLVFAQPHPLIAIDFAAVQHFPGTDGFLRHRATLPGAARLANGEPPPLNSVPDCEQDYTHMKEQRLICRCADEEDR